MLTLVTPTDAPTVIGPPQGQWTYEDWDNLPDDGNRYEIIDGVIYMSTAPSYFHQWIIKRMYRFWGVRVEEQELAYVDFAPIGVIMPGCDPVQPDMVVVLTANAHIIHDKCIMGVPDLIVEVISPGNPSYDEDIKKTAYENAGVPEFLIIDPRRRELRLFQLQSSGQYDLPAIFKETDTITFNCLPTIPLDIRKLFSEAPDNTL